MDCKETHKCFDEDLLLTTRKMNLFQINDDNFYKRMKDFLEETYISIDGSKYIKHTIHTEISGHVLILFWSWV